MRPQWTDTRRPSESGFTLLEIAVVLFIIGLMLTLIMPHVAAVRGVQLKSEARRLAGRVNYLYQRASTDKVVLRLTFDLDSDSYSVARLDPFAPQPAFVPDSEPGFAPVMLPVGVRLRDVTVQGTGTMSRGMVSCFFYPEGYVDATVVHLVDSDGAVFTLSLNPMTGRVAILRGDIDPRRALAG